MTTTANPDPEKALNSEDAKRMLKEAGIIDPMELTPQQREAAQKSKLRRRGRVLPSFDDIVRDAMLAVTTDFRAQQNYHAETAKQRDSKTFDPLVMQSTHSMALIRRQRQQTMLEQGSSTTAAYLQASAFWIGSVTIGVMTALTVAAAFQTHKMLLSVVPFGMVMAWRSYEAYEAVAEDLRFMNQAREIRTVKRSHIAEPSMFDALGIELDPEKQKMSPLERKRELRKKQEAEAAAALARQAAPPPPPKPAAAAVEATSAKKAASATNSSPGDAKASSSSSSTASAAAGATTTTATGRKISSITGSSALDMYSAGDDDDDENTGRPIVDKYRARKKRELEEAEAKLRKIALAAGTPSSRGSSGTE